ncbi:hypothetical protein EOD39_5332 [Acipenser ruthenus]|uniref:Uncharacterized protein n=1 Tax=Acipenser ruthenus TaxID=7906 RepID=A0A444UEM4_ACIRT|nr:hypothetical protein EOD39_5332 [Acipenser ruthenus]
MGSYPKCIKQPIQERSGSYDEPDNGYPSKPEVHLRRRGGNWKEKNDTFFADMDYIVISDSTWLSRKPALTYGGSLVDSAGHILISGINEAVPPLTEEERKLYEV